MTNTTTTATTQALTVAKDGKDFIVTNEAGEVLARTTTRREAREAKAEIEAEATEVPETPAEAEAEFLAEIEGQVKPIGVSLVKAYVTEVVAEAETITEDEEWVPAEDDTTESGEAPAVEAGVVTEVKVEAKPKAKAKTKCEGSSTYVGYWDEDVTEFTKKGKAAWVSTNCPGCNTKVRAGVWFTEKGEALNGDRGLAYLPKH
jgi:hypothetical protein